MKRTMTQAELLAFFLALKGATPATIVTRTEPKMRKTGNPFYGRVSKISSANVFINFDYGNAVRRQQLREGKEGDFEAFPRKWETRIPGTPIVSHTPQGSFRERYYLECRFLDSGAKTRYILDMGGREERPIERDEFRDFEPDRYSSAEHQGVDKEIILRDFDLASMIQVNCRGDEITVLR